MEGDSGSGIASKWPGIKPKKKIIFYTVITIKKVTIYLFIFLILFELPNHLKNYIGNQLIIIIHLYIYKSINV